MTPYVSDDRLDARVRDAGLGELSDLLHEVLTGAVSWPGDVIVPVPTHGREQIRNLIYSLLHQVGLKHEFKVISPQPDTLIVRQAASKHKAGPLSFGTQSVRYQTPGTPKDPNDVLGDEGLADLVKD